MKIIKAIAVGKITLTVLHDGKGNFYINASGETLPKKFDAEEVIYYLMSVIENDEE